MISYKQARDIILNNLYFPTSEKVNLSTCIGRILANAVYADRDFPPFDRVTMDGIAIKFNSFRNGRRDFRIENIGAAGQTQQSLKDPMACIEIMTGAPLPKGSDTVVRYEDLKKTETGYRIGIESIVEGKNVHAQGSDHSANDVLLPSHQKIKAIDVNVLATVGCHEVNVLSLPKVAVISSGDELIDVEALPLAHQIRRSNSYMIEARLLELGLEASSHHIADDYDHIVESISSLLKSHDVLLLTGGVSKGKFDYIPDALISLGFDPLFHGVAQRPGKPFWFSAKSGKYIFAFPGNPVSSLSCLHLYFIPWLQKSLYQNTRFITAKLSEETKFKPNLTYFAQAKYTIDDKGQNIVSVVHGNGSGDMVSPTKADGFAILYPGQEIYSEGTIVEFIPFSD